MTKPIFKGLVFAIASPLGGQWTDENVSRWVGLRKGVFSAEMTKDVTHLICSLEEFKSRGLRVKEALKRGEKHCRIVTLDWLDDCIDTKRKLPDKHYLLSATLKVERAKQRRTKKEKEGLELAKRFVNPTLNHIYTDATNFRYEVTITRDKENGGDDGQRFILYLFESNAKPHLYHFAAKFYKKHRDFQPHFFRPSETPKKFNDEFNRFKSFFYKKTGVHWDERLVGTKPVGGEFFSYQPPTGGKPVGCVPEKFIPRDPEDHENHEVLSSVPGIVADGTQPPADAGTEDTGDVTCCGTDTDALRENDAGEREASH